MTQGSFVIGKVEPCVSSNCNFTLTSLYLHLMRYVRLLQIPCGIDDAQTANLARRVACGMCVFAGDHGPLTTGGQRGHCSGRP